MNSVKTKWMPPVKYKGSIHVFRLISICVQDCGVHIKVDSGILLSPF